MGNKLELAEELWDEFSELMGTDISDVDRFAGSCVMTESKFKKALLKYEQQDEWFDVSKGELPESGKSVLCLSYHGRMVENSLELHTDKDKKWFSISFTHWRYLPTPPKTNITTP